MNNFYPQRIVCMTEESVELFHLLGRSDVIAGVSVYAKRPAGEVKKHTVISAFTHANSKKILAIKPDLVIGFSDIQKDIAKDLIALGLDVLITNQRSIEEIFKTMQLFGSIIGESQKSSELIEQFSQKIKWARDRAEKRVFKPRVYIEEWDEPQICGISWFSELVEICGGIDVFREKSRSGQSARERFVSHEDVRQMNPDIILASWCGKKVDFDSLVKRPGFNEISAIKEKRLFELEPEIFLQPGPALFVDGLDRLSDLFDSLNYS